MTTAATERLHPSARGLDALPGNDILSCLLSAQTDALGAVSGAIPEIEKGAELMARTVRGTGRLVYAGAGSSALMANADGMELSGTFGIDPGRIILLMAGGLPTGALMPGATEDDAAAGTRDADALTGADTVIAVTASGSTPYPMAVAAEARHRGANVIAIANNRDAPIFQLADVAVCLPTPPEVVAGSTRMGAGTAQKVALNMMSTLMGIRLGEVHDGMMVGLVADNEKLRARARAMVRAIAETDKTCAAASLDVANGSVKLAVLVARGASPDRARILLARCDGNLRAALARIEETGPDGRSSKSNPGSET